MEYKDRKCCFTGHRPEKMPFHANAYSYDFQQFQNALERAIQQAIHSGYRHFITGMSRGMDLWAAQIVLRFRRAYRDIVVEAAIPFEGQDLAWSQTDRALYQTIRSQCDSVVVLSPVYHPDVMHQRNRYMVDNASLLIAAYDGSPGGTRYTCEYARRKGLTIVNVFDEDYYNYSIL